MTVPVSDRATVVAASDLLASEFGDELIILNLRDGVYYGLEDVGTRIWQLLQRPISVPALRDALVTEFEVDPVRCEHDVRILLAELADKGLVEIRGMV
ncbi:MAG: PqqD family protein [Vicinamibacterales bacterium]